MYESKKMFQLSERKISTLPNRLLKIYEELFCQKKSNLVFEDPVIRAPVNDGDSREVEVNSV